MSPRRPGAVFSFPNPVNELAARVVAGGVVALCAATFAARQWWLLVPLAYGFWARALTGPTLSPLGQLATRLVAPHLGAPRLVPGPPKRFAQCMGVAFSTTSLVLWAGFGQEAAGLAVLALLTVAASAEAFLGFCAGCRIFGLLMQRGVIPGDWCESCGDLSRRHPELAAGSRRPS